MTYSEGNLAAAILRSLRYLDLPRAQRDHLHTLLGQRAEDQVFHCPESGEAIAERCVSVDEYGEVHCLACDHICRLA
jgi:predicted RNA-binding Zn-ribbon protein involved in translation (DUF1610 family)